MLQPSTWDDGDDDDDYGDYGDDDDDDDDYGDYGDDGANHDDGDDDDDGKVDSLIHHLIIAIINLGLSLEDVTYWVWSRV